MSGLGKMSGMSSMPNMNMNDFKSKSTTKQTPRLESDEDSTVSEDLPP